MAKINYKDETGNWKELPIGNTKSELVDIIYPVGSIYMSVNNTTPATLFGGTWEQIQDRFLLSAGSTYIAGNTGGAANHTPSGTVGEHTLTISEIPAHTHTYAKANETTGSHTLTIDEMPSHSHNTINYTDGYANPTQGQGTFKQILAGTNANESYQAVRTQGGGKGHTHTIGTTSTNTGSNGSGGSHSHSFTGTSQNTMPPYLVVYVWKRTA